MEKDTIANRGVAGWTILEGLTGLLGRSLLNQAWAACILGDLEDGPRRTAYVTEAREALAEAECERLANKDQYWYRQLGWAFAALVADEHSVALDLTRYVIQKAGRGEESPADILAHACWVAGHSLLRTGYLEMACAMAEQAQNHATLATDDTRAMQDAQDLWRTVELALSERAEGA